MPMSLVSWQINLRFFHIPRHRALNCCGGGFLSHRGTPKNHPLEWDFPLHTIQRPGGSLAEYGNPHETVEVSPDLVAGAARRIESLGDSSAPHLWVRQGNSIDSMNNQFRTLAYVGISLAILYEKGKLLSLRIQRAWKIHCSYLANSVDLHSDLHIHVYNRIINKPLIEKMNGLVFVEPN